MKIVMFLAGLTALGPLPATTPPGWVLPLLSPESRSYPAIVPAEVLLNEEHLVGHEHVRGGADRGQPHCQRAPRSRMRRQSASET